MIRATGLGAIACLLRVASAAQSDGSTAPQQGIMRRFPYRLRAVPGSSQNTADLQQQDEQARQAEQEETPRVPANMVQVRPPGPYQQRATVLTVR